MNPGRPTTMRLAVFKSGDEEVEGVLGRNGTLVRTSRTRGPLSALNLCSASGVTPPSLTCHPNTAPAHGIMPSSMVSAVPS